MRKIVKNSSIDFRKKEEKFLRKWDFDKITKKGTLGLEAEEYRGNGKVPVTDVSVHGDRRQLWYRKGGPNTGQTYWP